MSEPIPSRLQAYFKTTFLTRLFTALAAVGEVLSLAALIILAALTADFFVHKGRIPAFYQLPITEQVLIRDRWEAREESEKRELLNRFANFAPLQSLLLAKELPPHLAVAESAAVQAWAKSQKLLQPNVTLHTAEEALWQLELADRFTKRLSLDDETIRTVLQLEGDKSIHPVWSPRIGWGAIGMLANQPESVVSRLAYGWVRYFPGLKSSSAANANTVYLLTLAGLGLIFVLLRRVLGYLVQRFAAREILSGVLKLRRAIYHQCIRLGNRSSEGDGTFGAVSLALKGVESIHDYRLQESLRQLKFWPNLIILLPLALFASAGLFAVGVVIALAMWFILPMRLRVLRKKAHSSEMKAKLWLNRLGESLRMMRLVKAFGMEELNQGRVERQLAEYDRHQRHWLVREGIQRPILNLWIVLASILFLLAAASWNLSFGTRVCAIVTVALALVVALPVFATQFGRSKFQRKAAQAEEQIQEFLGLSGKIREMPDAEFLDAVRKQIRLEAIVWKDATDTEVLRSLDMSFPAGQVSGLVGASDEQKRAIFYMILRLSDPTSGSVRIDGKDLKYVSRESLRLQVGVVLQDQLTFQDTIANNIGCGEPGVSLPRIIEAAKIAHAHLFIQKLPHGYETVLSDKANNLTISQQYRIALARAILKDPSILLIEEPTDGLDDETKELLDDTVQRFFTGRTVIYIPHRISTLKACEKLYMIDNGTLIASGTHRELLHDSPLYKHLYYMEFNQFTAE